MDFLNGQQTTPAGKAINISMEYDPKTLVDHLRTIFLGWDVHPDVAESTSRNMINAHVHGHATHGVQLLPRYKKWLQFGILNRDARMDCNLDSKSMLDFNANKSFGHWALPSAIQQTARLDGQIKAFKLKNLGHTGYVAGCLRESMVDDHVVMLWINTRGSNLVVPHGGAGKLMSTTVIAAMVPGGYVLDMSTPTTAENAVHHAMMSNQLLPTDLIKGDGTPTRIPADLYANTPGGLNPLLSDTAIAFRDHKMFNLAIMSEILAGLMTNSGTNMDNGSFHSGCFGIMIRTDNGLAEHVKSYLRWLQQNPGVRIPGDRVHSSVTLLPWEDKILQQFLTERPN